MELKKINWEDKIALEDLEDVNEINKVTATNMNEIKDVVNSNSDYSFEKINELQTSITNTISKIDTATEELREQITQNDQWANDRISEINSEIEGINNNINTLETKTDNAVTLDGNQTITGNKTFNSNVIISNGSTPLVLKASDNNKHYLIYKNTSNETTFSLGSNNTGTSLEMNKGNLVIKAIENNKNVALENISKLKLNQTVLEAGMEINAGFGGSTVKFIPEDDSTKSLKFYNENPNDRRRFNLLVGEPENGNNPTTKNYVDNKVSDSIDAVNNTINSNIETITNNINTINQELATKQEIISVGDGLQLSNNLISLQNQLLNKWNGYQTLIETNRTNISTNTNAISTLNNNVTDINNLIQEIINGLRTAPIFEIVGDWVSGTTYRKNQAVYHNNKLWNSKVNNNTVEPSESASDEWFLISNFDVTTNGITQIELDNALRLKQDVLTGSNGIIISQDTNQVSIDSQLTNKWNGYENRIEQNVNNITSATNQINTINTQLTNTVTTNTSQTIGANKTLNGLITLGKQNDALVFKPGPNRATYMEFFNGTTRVGFVGKGSSANNNMNFGAERGKIILEARGGIEIPEPNATNSPTTKNYVDTQIGAINTQLTNTVTLDGNQTITGEKTFNGTIIVPEPTNNNNPATKQYVDEQIANNSGGGGGSNVVPTNMVTTDTNQTITGNKTFNSDVIISNGATPLVLKGVNNNKHYLLFKNSSNETTFSLGSASNNTSFEINRGDLTIQTLQSNKTVSIETGTFKLNRATLITGTNIYAGYGGAVVKFMPEDDSTKTLQFYNVNPTDRRRFNLKINEPTEAQNPATKNYVDTQISNIQIPTTISITKTQFQLSGGSVIGVGTADPFTVANGDYGLVLPAGIDINKVLNITLTLPAMRDNSALFYYSLTYSYGLYNGTPRIVVIVRKNGYTEPAGSLNLTGTTITVLTYNE